MLIDTTEKVAHLYSILDGVDTVALDTETSGLRPFQGSRLCGLSLGAMYPSKEIVTFYVPFRHESTEAQLPIAALRPIMQRLHGKIVITHNGKFDAKILYQDNAWPGQTEITWRDTMQLAYCLDAERFSFALDNLSWDWVGYRSALKDWPKLTAKARGYDLATKGYSQFAPSELAAYAESDAWMTGATYNTMWPRLSDPEAPWWGGPDLVKVYEEDMKLLWALLRMEINGMKVDVPRVKEQIAVLQSKAASYQTEMDLIAYGGTAPGLTINVNSNKQLRELFKSKSWPVPYDQAEEKVSFADVYLRTTAKEYTGADAEDLQRFARLVSNYRSCDKMRSSYFENFLNYAAEDGLIHADFWAHGTITGRLSCHEPALQTIPKRYSSSITSLAKSADEIVQSEVRMVFIPRSKDHRLYSIDFKNQEIRLFIHYADEPGMGQIVRSGGDVHHWTALQMLGAESEPPDHNSDAYARWRMLSKSITFGILYGMGIKKLANTLEISIEQAKMYYDKYMTTFPNVRKFMNRIIEVADSRGWIRTAWDRRLRFRKITDAERQSGKIKISKGYMHIARNMQNYVCHKALNWLIQGGCADQARQAVIRCDALLAGTHSYLINQIHDELLFELHVDEIDELLPKIKDAMTNWGEMFNINFDVDVEASQWSWGEAGL